MATNGTETAEVKTEHTEDYKKLVEYGINEKIAGELDSIYISKILSHGDLDERALDALKELSADAGVAVLKEFKDSNLEHVSNKSAFLCGVIKTHRNKAKMQGTTDATDSEKKPGPDEAKLKEIIDRTGYSLDYTTGQRKYGGPPPDWEGNQPGAGHEVFCGKIPHDIFEDELIPLFEKCGKIWSMRLMMDPMTSLNRGFCFCLFCDKVGAQEGVKQLDGFEIKPGKKLKVNVSVANVRLFVGNIPKSKGKEEIMEEFKKLTENLDNVIVYSSPDDPKKKNRGFAFLDYVSHKDASVAKRQIGNGRTRVWGCDIIVDWADPQEEPDSDTMSKVKVLYVKNLKADVTEEQLKENFEPFGKIERVKKIKDYGFVHFEDRDNAMKAMEALDGTKLGDSEMEISLAKPPSSNKNKEKGKRMGGQFGMGGWGGPMPGGGGRGGRGRGRGFGGGYGGYGGGYDDSWGGDYADDSYDYFDGSGDFYGGGYGLPQRSGGGFGGPGGGFGGMRGRGGRGGGGGFGQQGFRGGRGMGARGGGGFGQSGFRGGRGRGGMGGGMGGMGGRGGGGGAPRGGNKRRAGGEFNGGHVKRRNMNEGGWDEKPIAQQPLNDQQWFQDSYNEWN